MIRKQIVIYVRLLDNTLIFYIYFLLLLHSLPDYITTERSEDISSLVMVVSESTDAIQVVVVMQVVNIITES